MLRVDLHLHSPYSRGTSKKITIPKLAEQAHKKGLHVLGTSDFTHPVWLKEIRESLDEHLEYDNIKFILSTEISLIYTQDNSTKKIHLLILAPSFEVVEQINGYLGKKGRLDYDGRPIFGMNCPEVVENIMAISKAVEIIPAHIWTTWFSLFGANSGFDSIEKCFQDQAKHIHALETGLSSDPEMNWMLSSLDNYTLVSNSDAHSPYLWRLGRECNVFDIEKPSYKKILNCIRTKKKFLHTLEFFPQEGKYHFDGHRKCNVRMSPEEAIKHNNICPKCGKKMTIGVMHRVKELADREQGYRPESPVSFKHIIPLHEIVAYVLDMGRNTKTVNKKVNEFLKIGSELDILLNIEKGELQGVDKKIAQAIIKMRNDKVDIEEGYDGKYGEISVKGDSLQDFV